MNKKRLFTLSLRWLALILLLVSFTQLFSTTAAQEPAVPQTTPDATVGLEIFAERCAPCHGPSGDGDGSMAGNLPIPPAAFSNPEYRKSAVPGAMFDNIFNGIISSGMPPFGEGTESQRPIPAANLWDLTAAIYTLGTPAEQIAQGQSVFEENCQSCHGPAGQGDGPDAAGLDSAALDITGLDYWFTRSNEMVYAAITSGSIAEHDYSLTEDDQWAVVDYARTFGYTYTDPNAPAPPVEFGTVRGIVTNGTTEEPLADAEVKLRAFTVNFEETLNLTATTDADGAFSFDLEDVPSDWVYLVSSSYGDLNFSSDAGRVSNAEPELELPVTVYDKTSDATMINIDQMHVIIDLFDGGIAVTELYVFGNQSAAVFVGESGNMDEGTVQITLPEGAEEISFERAMGSFENAIPATEFFQTGDVWSDTFPLNPGSGSLTLIVRYVFPYEDSADLSHQLKYRASQATIILPDAGIEVDDSSWSFQGAQQMGEGSAFLMYDRTELPAGTELTIPLSGKPQFDAVGGNGSLPERDKTSELLIGAGALLLIAAAAVFVIRNWQARTDADEQYEDEEEAPPVNAAAAKKAQLLQSIVALDRAFKNGELEESDYTAQREQLKQELKQVWH